MTPGRKLKARRPAPPFRLIEQGDAGSQETPELSLERGVDAPPITLMRLGNGDLDAGLKAIESGARPTAVITGVGEARETTARARRLTRESEVAWLSDPLLFRTGLQGYRTSYALEALDYTPGRDDDPYSPSEFDDADLVRRVGRSTVGSQVDLGAGGALSGAFVVSSMEDPWLPVNQRLLRIGSAEASGWDMPLIGILPLRMSGFESMEAQTMLVRALSARQPKAWLLMIDGLSEDRSPKRIASALRLALLLQEAGAPVILARAGDLRQLFWAFGVGGAEFGLGRLFRFLVPDFTKAKGGPGPTAGPRVELPSLCLSLPFDRGMDLVGRGVVAEVECSCPVCRASGGLRREAASVAGHDAHVVTGQAEALGGVDGESRVGGLERRLRAGRREWRRVEAEGIQIGSPARIERMLGALEEAVKLGLLQPGELSAQQQLRD